MDAGEIEEMAYSANMSELPAPHAIENEKTSSRTQREESTQKNGVCGVHRHYEPSLFRKEIPEVVFFAAIEQQGLRRKVNWHREIVESQVTYYTPDDVHLHPNSSDDSTYYPHHPKWKLDMKNDINRFEHINSPMHPLTLRIMQNYAGSSENSVKYPFIESWDSNTKRYKHSTNDPVEDDIVRGCAINS